MAKEDNLKPFNSETARLAGQKSSKKGTRHLKTIIQEIGNNIDWSKTTLKNKDQMNQLYGNNGWKALVYVAFTKAMAGDPKAMDFLAKNGYGQMFDLTTDGEPLNVIIESSYARQPKFRTDETPTETS
jgi:hypothetical protein